MLNGCKLCTGISAFVYVLTIFHITSRDNQLISCIHYLFYDGKTDSDRKLYEVRTRKILSYSNLIASGTNIAVTAITNDFSKLDIGGLAVTIYRLITDAKFIREVKEEFIFGSYKDIVMGE